MFQSQAISSDERRICEEEEEEEGGGGSRHKCHNFRWVKMTQTLVLLGIVIVLAQLTKPAFLFLQLFFFPFPVFIALNPLIIFQISLMPKSLGAGL